MTSKRQQLKYSQPSTRDSVQKLITNLFLEIERRLNLFTVTWTEKEPFIILIVFFLVDAGIWTKGFWITMLLFA